MSGDSSPGPVYTCPHQDRVLMGRVDPVRVRTVTSPGCEVHGIPALTRAVDGTITGLRELAADVRP